MKILFFIVALLASTLSNANSVPEFYGQIKQVKVDKASISYYRFGYGAPLVMLTGHGDSMNMWHPTLLKKLSQTREVIIFDYPGIGQSTIEGAYPNSMEQLSTLVRGFIATQKLNKPDMLGFSMGGSLLLDMTAKHASEFNHVVLIGAKAGGSRTILPDEKNFSMLSQPDISPAVAIKKLLFPATASAQADSYLKMLSQIPQSPMNKDALQAQNQAVNASNTGDGLWAQLGNIHNPTMIINGIDDILTPVQNAVMIASSIPGAWLIQIRGAGHGVLFQEPDYTGELIELFLSY